VLTKLRFRLKEEPSAPSSPDAGLVQQFDVLLYPNSVFIIPLETNRLYTHEIVPSALPIQKLPTRMGYVLRCSETLAMHKDGQTFLKDASGKLVPLVGPPHTTPEAPHTLEMSAHIKQLYAQENLTIDLVTYGFLPFTFNQGDLHSPIVRTAPEQ
jgi:hypothetical protein